MLLVFLLVLVEKILLTVKVGLKVPAQLDMIITGATITRKDSPCAARSKLAGYRFGYTGPSEFL